MLAVGEKAGRLLLELRERGRGLKGAKDGLPSSLGNDSCGYPYCIRGTGGCVYSIQVPPLHIRDIVFHSWHQHPIRYRLNQHRPF
jgi:hypothetical protein